MALVGWVVLGCLRLHTVTAVPWFMLFLFLFMKSNVQNVAKSFLQKDRIKVSKHRVKITSRTHLFYSLFMSSCLAKTTFLTNEFGEAYYSDPVTSSSQACAWQPLKNYMPSDGSDRNLLQFMQEKGYLKMSLLFHPASTLTCKTD